jgi:hypothetical protein
MAGEPLHVDQVDAFAQGVDHDGFPAEMPGPAADRELIEIREDSDPEPGYSTHGAYVEHAAMDRTAELRALRRENEALRASLHRANQLNTRLTHALELQQSSSAMAWSIGRWPIHAERRE